MRARERGIALVSVLWGVAILSVIVATMLATNIANTRVDRNNWSLARANALADGGVHRAILALLDTRPDHVVRADGTPWRFSLGGVRMTIAIQDENGLIDLNNAGPDVLTSLFQSVGMNQDQAKALAASIVALQPQNAPPNAVVFHTVDELLNVPGVTPTLFAQIGPALTVYSHSSTVDTNVAPRIVLAAMPGMDPATIDDMLAQRDAAFRTGTLAAPALGANRAFAITVWVVLDNVRVIRHAVVQFTGDKDKPFWFIAWS